MGPRCSAKVNLSPGLSMDQWSMLPLFWEILNHFGQAKNGDFLKTTQRYDYYF
jgi:hypothetical protein